MIKQKKTVYFLIVISGVILMVSTMQNQEVAYSPPEKLNTSKIQPDQTNVLNIGNVGTLSIQFPAEWIQEAPSSSMRVTQFRIPNENGENGELAIFNKIGGSVEENLRRWVGQFSQSDGSSSEELATYESKNISGNLFTFMFLTGDYSSGGMMGNPPVTKTNFAIHAAIVELPEDTYYFKMTGPEKIVKRWKSEFREAIQNANDHSQ